jgi:hypothetical protein
MLDEDLDTSGDYEPINQFPNFMNQIKKKSSQV